MIVTGHILDDEDLISTLQQSKTMSVEIGGRMNLSEQTEKDMNNMRKKYLPVSDKVCLSTSYCPMLTSHFLTLTSQEYYVPFTIFLCEHSFLEHVSRCFSYIILCTACAWSNCLEHLSAIKVAS